MNNQIPKEGPRGANERLGGLGWLGVEDFKGEESVVGGHGENEALVPDGADRTRVVGLGGDASIRVEVEHGIGLKVALLPIDVLEVFGADDDDLGFQRKGCG